VGNPDCLRCGRAMAEGFLLDRGSYDYPQVAQWVEDPPVKSFWSGLAMEGKQQIPIRAFRCEGCGTIEFRAPSA
jgi:hypothetical protein